MATGASSQTKNTRQRGGAFEGEIEEKGLDGRDRQREGKRQTIRKRRRATEVKSTEGEKKTRSGYKRSIHWLGNYNGSK